MTSVDDGASPRAGRPLLLLDVDGVLNPLRVRDLPGFTPHELGEPGTAGHVRVLLSPDHGRWLTLLGDVFDLVWATSWEQEADLLIAERVGLPRGLPFIRFTEQRGWTSKLPDVIRFVGERAVAWVDDQLDPAAHAWAESREAPTLLVETDHRVGLELEHIAMYVPSPPRSTRHRCRGETPEGNGSVEGSDRHLGVSRGTTRAPGASP